MEVGTRRSVGYTGDGGGSCCQKCSAVELRVRLEDGIWRSRENKDLQEWPVC